MYWHDMNAWAWIPMMLFTLLFLGLLAWLVLRLLPGAATDRGTSGPSARRLLDARLARGEIDADEYERTRRLLEHRPPAAARGESAGSGTRAEPPAPPGETRMRPHVDRSARPA